MRIFRTVSILLTVTLAAAMLSGCGSGFGLQGETLEETYPHKADLSGNGTSADGVSSDGRVSSDSSDSSAAAETVSADISSEKETYDIGRSDVSEDAVSGNTGEGIKDGQLKVTGTHITDRDGNIVMLRGVSTHGLNWYPEYANADALKTLKEDWNVNLIRLALYTDGSDGYCSLPDNKRADLRNLIDNAVVSATEMGMYVIIDWHILQDGDPNKHIGEAKEYFTYLAEKYQNNTNVIYEICNEPNGNTSWADIRKYAEQIIPIIREKTDAVIIVGTPEWSQDVDAAAEDPLDYDNIVYALHFYAATHKTQLQDKLDSAFKKGLPVFVSEFGICDASGNGTIDKDSADTWMSILKEDGIGSCIWNLSNKNEASALIDPYCTKTSGWKYDELSTEGKWYYDRK